MLPRKFGPTAAWFILFGCLIALLYFGYQTFQSRLQTGNALPEYSTYRADPKGLKVLYDGLGSTDRITTSRRLQASINLPSGENQVLVFAGVSPSGIPASKEDSELLDHWLATGGRLIIAFRSGKITPKNSIENTDAERYPQKDPTFSIPWDTLIRRWGAHLIPVTGPSPDKATYELFATGSRWFSDYAFDRSTSDWKSVATVGHQNVIVERMVGAGSIVLLADTYPLSNEGLATDRQTDFLLWLINDRVGVIFDEIHLGIAEHAGIMTLARRYGLQGALISFVAVGLLFIWRCQYSLIPRKKPDTDRIVVSGSGSEQTFLNLLQRSVPQKDLLHVCIETWLKSAKLSAAQIATARKFQSGAHESKSAIDGYNELTTLLNENL